MLAAEPGVKIDAKRAAQQIYALALVDAGRTAAQDGDLPGAAEKFKAALQLDSTLGLDPEGEAMQVYTRSLLYAGQAAARAGDLVGAVGKFGKAVALDSTLAAAPPAYVQIICVSGAGSRAVEDTAALCRNVDAVAKPFALGDTVDASVAEGAVGFWSIDVPNAMKLAVDVHATSGEFAPHLYLIGPDGAILADKVDGGAGASIEAALPQAGAYLAAVVGEYSGGDYVLTVYDADAGQG